MWPSTQHRDKTVVADDNSKPEIISYYNATKSGVDVVDKLVRTYSVKRSTRRWGSGFASQKMLFRLPRKWLSLRFKCTMLDIAAHNALVLWITANPNWHPAGQVTREAFVSA